VPSIAVLEAELVSKVQEVAALSERSFSVYNMDEILSITDDGFGFPLAGVAYLGTSPRQNSVEGTSGVPRGATDLVMVDKQFAILVGVEYNWSDGENTKPVATDLLDAVRGKLLGFSGVSRRPWRLIDEGPTNSSLNGAILYMQIWETTSIDQGDSA
jgi:hypothetical protein